MLPKSADTLAFRDVLERLVVFPGKEGNDTKLLSARLQHSMQVEHGVGDVARNVLNDMGVKYEIIRVRRLVIEIGKTNRIDVLGRTPVPVRIEVGTLTSSRRKDAPTAGVGLECDRPSLFFEG